MSLQDVPGPVAAVPPRRAPVWPWFVSLAGLVVAVAVAAGGLWVAWEVRDAARASRTVTAVQQEAIGAAIGREAQTADRIRAQRAAYRSDLAAWDADEADVAAWRESDAEPPAGTSNPGGAAMPGEDPTGRAFLDSIGAGDVRVVFDAGKGNCGYDMTGDEGWSYAAGGCYDSAYRNRLFLAWDPGAEKLVHSVFVHEAMHWYQYEYYYSVFVHAARSGVEHEAYARDIESDASCRAVYVHGIARSEYEDSSSPCDIDDWYEGWLVDRIAERGAVLSAPSVAAYEVVPVVRP